MGTATCWGSDRSGQSDAPHGRFKAVAAGREHSCGLRADGTVICWGADRYGQTDAPAGTFTTLSTGVNHSCAVSTEGIVACWGDNFLRPIGVPLKASSGR